MRLFVALLPPREAHVAIENAALPLQDALGVKALPPDNWHITLFFIGEADETRIGAIGDALSAIEFSPFTVSLFGAGAYPSIEFPRAIFIGGKSEGAEELAGKIGKALAAIGVRGDGKKFSMHLTVARSKTAGDIEEFVRKTGDVCKWEASSFFLMKSTLLPHGAKYDIIKEFPAK